MIRVKGSNKSICFPPLWAAVPTEQRRSTGPAEAPIIEQSFDAMQAYALNKMPPGWHSAYNSVDNRSRRTNFAFALLITILGFTIIGPAEASVKSDIAAFNDTIAAGSPACSKMAANLNLLFPTPLTDAGTGKPFYPYAPPLKNVTIWRQTANAAKVCGIDVHGETNDAAPARVPKMALARACAELKIDLTKAMATEASLSSWACGWPAPIPEMRTVPGPF